MDPTINKPNYSSIGLILGELFKKQNRPTFSKHPAGPLQSSVVLAEQYLSNHTTKFDKFFFKKKRKKMEQEIIINKISEVFFFFKKAFEKIVRTFCTPCIRC